MCQFDFALALGALQLILCILLLCVSVSISWRDLHEAAVGAQARHVCCLRMGYSNRSPFLDSDLICVYGTLSKKWSLRNGWMAVVHPCGTLRFGAISILRRAPERRHGGTGVAVGPFCHRILSSVNSRSGRCSEEVENENGLGKLVVVTTELATSKIPPVSELIWFWLPVKSFHVLSNWTFCGSKCAFEFRKRGDREALVDGPKFKLPALL